MEQYSKIVVAVTGASGAIYARQTIEALLAAPSIEQVAVIVSENGRAVAQYENEHIPEPGGWQYGVMVEGNLPDSKAVYNSAGKLVGFDNGDMFTPPASGSARFDAMVIVPCSMGSVGRIASGVSLDLIGRAADVMLKERRRLVLVVRETPLSTIHLRNLTTISECGGIILPASPSFYSRPLGIEELCNTVTGRILDLLNIENKGFRWGE